MWTFPINEVVGGEQKIQSWHVILVFFAFFISLVLIISLKKIYFWFWFKKKYYVLPRLGIKGITNIAMVVSLSVAVLILITLITSNVFSVLFRAFPGTRVTIEGILIKIGGLLFGPFLGLFIGLLTDLLSVLMTAGIFHYGYFIAALAYGLFAGTIKSLVTFSSNKNINLAIYSTIALILTLIATVFYIETFLINGLNISIANLTISIPKNIIQAIMASFLGLSILIIWISFFVSYQNNKKNNISFKKRYVNFKEIKILTFNKSLENNKKNKKDNFIIFCATFTCVIITEIFINIQAMPLFDSEVTTIKFQEWLSIRISLFLPMVLFNLLVIYPVYSIIFPLVTYDYEKELEKIISSKATN